LLVEMRAAGAEWRDIANKLNRIVAACEGRLVKLKKERARVEGPMRD
jgi:hypothetical protein